MALRLRIFVTHPVQYHVPLWRELAAHPDLDVRVIYFSDQGVKAGLDKGFGVPVTWDVDLLSGYESSFVSRNGDLERWHSMRLPDVDGLLAKERPDWVLFSGYTYSFERQLARRAGLAGAKILMRAEFCDLSERRRGAVKDLARNAYLRWFYRRVDRFCYPGEMGKAHLLNHGVDPARMFHSPYSVDGGLIEAQKRAGTREQARAELGIPDDRFVYLFSGKLIPRKAPFDILDAIASLPAREAVGLIVLGDGELRSRFEPRARELLGERLVLPGFVNQSQLGKYFMAADALVLPSLHETWGLVVNEAMHHGLPAIVSDQVGCFPNLVREGQTGHVYPCGNVAALAACMQSMLDDRIGTRALGAAAQAQMGAYSIAASANGVIRALGLTG